MKGLAVGKPAPWYTNGGTHAFGTDINAAAPSSNREIWTRLGKINPQTLPDLKRFTKSKSHDACPPFLLPVIKTS